MIFFLLLICIPFIIAFGISPFLFNDWVKILEKNRKFDDFDSMDDEDIEHKKRENDKKIDDIIGAPYGEKQVKKIVFPDELKNEKSTTGSKTKSKMIDIAETPEIEFQNLSNNNGFTMSRNGKFDIEQVNKKDLDELDLDSSENTPIKEYGILNKIKKYTKK